MRIMTPLVMLVLGVGVTIVASTPLSPWFRWALLAILAGMLIGAPLFGILGYEVEPGRLSVVRPGWRTRIRLAGLRGIDDGEGVMNSSLRLAGNGGFWSFTGLFWSRRLGRFRAYVNDPRRAIALRFEGRCLVVSPDRGPEFVRCVREAALAVSH